MEIALNNGDIFLTRNPMWLGKAINGVQRFWSTDNASKYSHAGIIISKKGKTLESLWTVSSQDIYEAYNDTEVLIARHKDMTYDKFIEGYFGIHNHIGQIYPFYRLGLHLIPPLAKYIHVGRLVCSEFATKFENRSGVHSLRWYGQTPDTIHDRVKNSKYYDIIFEGKLNKDG